MTDVMAEATIYMQGYNRERGHMSDMHWTIDYDCLMRNVGEMCVTVVKGIWTREPDWFSILEQSVKTIKQSVKEIKDENYCVYLRIKEIVKKKGNKIITVEKVMPANKEEKCDYQKVGFNCPHFGRDENCNCDKERTESSLKALKKQGIIKK